MVEDPKNELKKLAERLLSEIDGMHLDDMLNESRKIYEHLLIASYEKSRPKEPSVLKEPTPEIAEKPKKKKKAKKKKKEPLTLSDLFVPTFDDIKDDMSQKEEFKDTISLDDTENLFNTKKDEARQLSLNDRLYGNHIQVGLNDRIAFVNKLFNFSQADFNRVLEKLNSFNNKDEAMNFFQYQVKPNYNWKGKEDLEERFINLIERKFL